jgi:hypothetical protein
VLATASEAFEKMLFGSFQEASKDKDEEIKLGLSISFEAFDLAMRYPKYALNIYFD